LTETVIVFERVTKEFKNGDKILEDISFKIEPGEFIVITGPSGSGKTSIGRLLIHDLIPTKGKISVNGEDISDPKFKHQGELRRQIGVVFQDYKIILDKTVAENIALVLEIADLPKSQIDSRIDKLLEIVGITSKKHLFPSQLSGGELQRAVIARAIATDPKILFADEPTGNLDKATSKDIFKLLQKINSTGTTVIMATHDETLFENENYRHLHVINGKLTEDIPASHKAKDSNKSKKHE
jgi:cell division transport system ATP-binding protein